MRPREKGRIPVPSGSPFQGMKKKAASGFEPLHRGFADLSLNHLGTPPLPVRGCDRNAASAGIARGSQRSNAPRRRHAYRD